MATKGSCYRFSKEKAEELLRENRFYFGKNGKGAPQIKRYLSEVKQGVTPMTIWKREEVGDSQTGDTELKALGLKFSNPKPESLIHRILEIATNKGDLVMDSFLGSGTTAAVALKMGRTFIGIEKGTQAETHCIARLEKVVAGEKGGISEKEKWQGGGGFSFFKLGEKVFNNSGDINPKVTFETLAAFIWQKETGTSIELLKSPFLGTFEGKNIFLLYNGVLGDDRPEAGNVLTPKLVRQLEKEFPVNGERLIYGEAIFGMSQEELAQRQITFKQIPYDVGG